jgi:molybdopterin synthase sulfur carrier subunit
MIGDERHVASSRLRYHRLVPTVSFTPHLQRFLDVPRRDVPGATLGEVLEAVFAENPRLKGYVLDDQGQVRRHVTIFVGGQPIRDRHALTDPVGADAEVYVLQALSGG